MVGKKGVKPTCNHCHSNAAVDVWVHIDHWNEGMLFCFECTLFSTFQVQKNEKYLGHEANCDKCSRRPSCDYWGLHRADCPNYSPKEGRG